MPKQRAVKGENSKPTPDFLVVDNTKPQSEWVKIDFMYTLESNANVEQFLLSFNQSPIQWKKRTKSIVDHINKADIVPMCTKHFNNSTLIKILGFVLSLPKELQEKVIFIKE